MKHPLFNYIFALLLFGANGILSAQISLNSYKIVLLRTCIGAILLISLFLLTRRRCTFPQKRRALFFLSLSGIAMGISWMFLYEAYQEIGVSLASLAYYCGPVLVMAVSPFLFHEKITLSKLLGLSVVLMGIFLVNGYAPAQVRSPWGLFCGGMSALLYAVMVIANKKASAIEGLENGMLQLLFSFLAVAVFTGLKGNLFFPVAPQNWLPILLLGIVNTGMGCYLYFASIGHLPVQTVAICGYIEPLSAVIFSVLLLQETMTSPQILGAVLILGGAAMGELLSLQKKRGIHQDGVILCCNHIKSEKDS